MYTHMLVLLHTLRTDNGDSPGKHLGQGTSIEHYLLFSPPIGLQIIKVFTIQNEIINTY